jgi:hypothetical protein
MSKDKRPNLTSKQREFIILYREIHPDSQLKEIKAEFEKKFKRSVNDKNINLTLSGGIKRPKNEELLAMAKSKYLQKYSQELADNMAKSDQFKIQVASKALILLNKRYDEAIEQGKNIPLGILIKNIVEFEKLSMMRSGLSTVNVDLTLKSEDIDQLKDTYNILKKAKELKISQTITKPNERRISQENSENTVVEGDRRTAEENGAAETED